MRFILLALVGVAGLAFMAVASPYRWQRLVTFLDPWADPFGSGYQLTQSLMAYGRGEIFGQGLGNSIQKLEYLLLIYRILFCKHFPLIIYLCQIIFLIKFII